jgi:hypothetical protein
MKKISIIIPRIIQTSLSYDQIVVFSRYKFYFWATHKIHHKDGSI